MSAAPYPQVRSRRDLLDRGWSDGAICRAVARGRLVRLRTGYYATPGAALDPIAAAIAAARATTNSAVSHRSASLLRNMPILGVPPSVAELSIGGRRSGDVSNAHLYRARLPAHHVESVDGIRVTTVARTIADLARSQSITAAVVAGDFALREQTTTCSELQRILADCRGWPGIRRARAAVEMLDGRSESPLESYSRVRLVQRGVAIPDLQTNIMTQRDRLIGRVDFYWDEMGVVGEADGHSKYDDRATLIAEKRRQERLEEMGLVVVRWTWSDVRDQPQLLIRRLDDAFARGRRRDAVGSPRRWVAKSSALSLDSPVDAR